MRIEWIEVENFKGFDKRRFEFDEAFTLIVGENGSGKTSVITALRFALSGWVNACNGAGTALPSDCIRVVGHQVGSVYVFEPSLPLKYAVKFSGFGDPVDFALEATSAEREHLDQVGASFLRRFHSVAQALIASHDTSMLMPLAACYPASRAFQAGGRPDFNKVLASRPKRADGYQAWDNPQTSPTVLTEWLGRWQLIQEEDHQESKLFANSKGAILKALPDIRDLRFSPKRGEVVIERNNGELLDFSKLSDGQRSSLAMVGDIARRSAILNPHVADPVTETPGVVLIDEIDLHLHPRWQRRIMEDLRRVFPKIQFIATTHSPIIISAAKDAKVIHLDADGSHEVPQAYGMDVNWVVDVVQGAESQPPEVAALVREADEFIEEGELEKARAIAGKLERIQSGPSPDSVGIISRIENLIALAHAED